MILFSFSCRYKCNWIFGSLWGFYFCLCPNIFSTNKEANRKILFPCFSGLSPQLIRNIIPCRNILLWIHLKLARLNIYYDIIIIWPIFLMSIVSAKVFHEANAYIWHVYVCMYLAELLKSMMQSKYWVLEWWR